MLSTGSYRHEQIRTAWREHRRAITFEHCNTIRLMAPPEVLLLTIENNDWIPPILPDEPLEYHLKSERCTDIHGEKKTRFYVFCEGVELDEWFK